jgi:hypothetical protein
MGPYRKAALMDAHMVPTMTRARDARLSIEIDRCEHGRERLFIV